MIRTSFLIAIYACFLQLAACTVSDTMRESEEYLDDANYHQAYWAMEAARRENPNDPTIEKRFWELRVIYLLAQAREMVFHNRDTEALHILERVLVLDPENPTAYVWIRKAKSKLAKQAIDEGILRSKRGELSAALRSYNEALTYQPEDPEALKGIEELDAIWAERRELAQERFMQGVRAMAEQQYKQTKYQMENALDQDPSLDRAKLQKDRAMRRLAEQRHMEAVDMESAGFFAPALSNYIFVRTVIPDWEGIDDSIARLEAEVKAIELADQGEMAVLRGDFEAAHKLLEEAFETCTFSKLTIGEKLELVRDRELRNQYMDARDLELEFHYEEALTAFKAIAESASGGYEDVLSRINDLEAAIAAAEAGHAAGLEAEEAEDLPAAIEQYQEVLIHYPGYKDLEERIRELQARLKGVGQEKERPQPQHSSAA
ncbi:MAG: hypothetical protein ACYTG5_11765 [Planctomycetota bacterium]|jgi:tetratricopeptide (TPR) repeat protein